MVTDRRSERAVTVVGWLFVIYGLSCLLEVIVRAFDVHIHLDLGVLAIPVGIGVLRRRPAARRWAVIAARLNTALILCVGPFFAFAEGPLDVQVLGKVVGHAPKWSAFAVLVSYLLVCLWITYSLTRPKAMMQFQDSTTHVSAP